MLRFAAKTLFHDRGKLLTALGGVVFSLVLVNVQGGLYFGLMGKASVLTDRCEADVWIGHEGLENVDFAFDIPEHWLGRIRGLPDVARAEPYVVSKGVASLPGGGFEDVWILGAPRGSMLGGGWEFVEGSRDDLRKPFAVSFDDVEDHKFGNPQVGDVIEINRQRVKLAARTRGVLSFHATPFMFTTIDNARRLARIPNGYCSYLLVKTEPGADVFAVRDEIRRLLPDADVYESREFAAMSQDYFLRRTGIGISFGAATLLGVFVGILMVGQSLYALALDRLQDFATLKAIGAGEGQLLQVVFAQAVTVATVGSAIGIGFVVLIERTASTPIAPIVIPPYLVAAGVVLVFGICILATAFPVLRIRRIDPATVLQG